MTTVRNKKQGNVGRPAVAVARRCSVENSDHDMAADYLDRHAKKHRSQLLCDTADAHPAAA